MLRSTSLMLSAFSLFPDAFSFRRFCLLFGRLEISRKASMSMFSVYQSWLSRLVKQSLYLSPLQLFLSEIAFQDLSLTMLPLVDVLFQETIVFKSNPDSLARHYSIVYLLTEVWFLSFSSELQFLGGMLLKEEFQRTTIETSFLEFLSCYFKDCISFCSFLFSSS